MKHKRGYCQVSDRMDDSESFRDLSRLSTRFSIYPRLAWQRLMDVRGAPSSRFWPPLSPIPINQTREHRTNRHRSSGRARVEFPANGLDRGGRKPLTLVRKRRVKYCSVCDRGRSQPLTRVSTFNRFGWLGPIVDGKRRLEGRVFHC